MKDFAAASALTPIDDATFAAGFPDGWQQGRGAFGGLVLAVLARAIEHSEPDRARALRTISGDICGPVLPGAATVRVRVLRRGSNQSNLQAELSQGGEVLASATAVLSAPRRVTTAPYSAPPPPAGAFEQLVPLPMGPPPSPTFTQHYEYRTDGPLPFSGAGGDPICLGFIREKQPLATLDAPALIGRLDSYWPTLYSIDATVRPMATISFTAQLLADPASLPPTAPMRYRSRMQALSDGFFVEFRELWLDDRVIALNQQTFVVIK